MGGLAKSSRKTCWSGLICRQETRVADCLNRHGAFRFAVDSFSAKPLRKNASPVLDDTSLVITRAAKSSGPGSMDMPLVEVLSELVQSLGNAKNIRVKFKVFRVDPPDNQQVATSAYYQASGELPAGFVQQNATWHCIWDISKQPIRLAKLSIDDYEEIVPKTTGRLRFTDVTQSALGQTDSFRRQLTREVDYWRGRLESNYGVDPNGNQGLAVGDVNGDGLDDVFVCQQGGLPTGFMFITTMGRCAMFRRQPVWIGWKFAEVRCSSTWIMTAIKIWSWPKVGMP